MKAMQHKILDLFTPFIGPGFCFFIYDWARKKLRAKFQYEKRYRLF